MTLLRTLPSFVRPIALALFTFMLGAGIAARAQTVWRAATAPELEAALPSRALVGKERIETEMRTATGITDGKGHIIAAVVLITAGYAADGKYSHYLLLQSPVRLAGQALRPGTYVVGWSRLEDSLAVHIFDAASGNEVANPIARPIPGSHRVESFHVWPPADHPYIQIGRYMLPYEIRP